MAMTSILGLFSQATRAADGVAALKKAGFTERDFEILTGSPYPEGAFGERSKRSWLFIFPIVGAACGLAVGLLLTIGTQIAYPLPTGGKPLLSIPPMVNVMYESTLLGAIIMTVIGILFEARLPRVHLGLYDKRITEGYIGLLVSAEESRIGRAREALHESGAEDIVEKRQDES